MTTARYELESEILRFLVESPELASKYVVALSEVYFNYPDTKEAYATIESYVVAQKKFDRTIIVQDLSSQAAINIFDIPAEIDESDIKIYIDKLKNAAQKQEIIDHLGSAELKLRGRKVTAKDFAADEIEFYKDVLDSSARSDDEISMGLSDYVEEHRKIIDDVRNGKILGVTTGFSLLDDYMVGGFKEGDLVLIGARPSVGKTSLSLSFAYNAAKAGHSVLFVSVEMARKDIFERLLAFHTGLPLTEIIRGQVDLEQAYSELSNLNIRIIEASSFTSKDVMNVATKEKYIHNIDIIFVDYLQYLGDIAKGQSENIRVGRISKNLKRLAGTLKIPVVSPTQLNRKSEMRGGESKGIPSLEDLRDSGNLEQDADIVILLSRRSLEDPENALLHIAKNRKGETGAFDIKYNQQTTMFSEGDVDINI